MYSNVLFSSQLMLSWCWVLVLIFLMSKSVIIGLLHSRNWLKSWMFVHPLEFYSRFNIWCTWIGSEYFKSLDQMHIRNYFGFWGVKIFQILPTYSSRHHKVRFVLRIIPIVKTYQFVRMGIILSDLFYPSPISMI